MPFFKKKPVVIEAIQMTEEMRTHFSPLPHGVNGHVYPGDLGKQRGDEEFPFTEIKPFWVETLEGKMSGYVGDYLIIGIKGEKYFCRKDIFEQTYEPVDA